MKSCKNSKTKNSKSKYSKSRNLKSKYPKSKNSDTSRDPLLSMMRGGTRY